MMPSDRMTDRERILTEIITRLTSTMMFAKMKPSPKGGMWIDYDGDASAQFVGTYVVKPSPGDIVQCNTQFSPEWKYAVFLEDNNGANGGHWLLREIGGMKTVRMFNESLSVLVGVPPHIFYEGHQRQLYEWATSAAFSERYNPKAEHLVRSGGAEFVGDILRVWVRPHIFIPDEKTVDGKTVYVKPWFVELKWSEKTRLKDIVDAMIAAGFPREWEYGESKSDRVPQPITRETILAVLEKPHA